MNDSAIHADTETETTQANAETTEHSPETTEQTPVDVLLGSSKQPATFELEDGTVLTLGDIVRRALEHLRLTQPTSVDDWNAIPDEIRELAIQDQVDLLPLKKAPEPEAVAETETAQADESTTTESAGEAVEGTTDAQATDGQNADAPADSPADQASS